MAVVVRGVGAYKKKISKFETDSQKAIERDLKRASIALRSDLLAHMSQTRRTDKFLGVLSGRGPNLVRRTGATVSRLSPGGLVTVMPRNKTITTISVVGSPDPHLKFLEEGGDKAPPQGNSIPLAPHQTPAGADRYPFASRGKTKDDGSFGFLSDVFIYPTNRMLHPGGEGPPRRQYPKDKYLVRRKGKGKNAKLEFLRMYKDRVHVRGRRLFYHAIRRGRRDLPPALNGSMRVLAREANR